MINAFPGNSMGSIMYFGLIFKKLRVLPVPLFFQIFFRDKLQGG
jgi:hypothetical protein